MTGHRSEEWLTTTESRRFWGGAGRWEWEKHVLPHLRGYRRRSKTISGAPWLYPRSVLEELRKELGCDQDKLQHLADYTGYTPGFGGPVS